MGVLVILSVAEADQRRVALATPANSRLGDGGLACIYVSERASEVDLVVAKPVVGGGLDCRLGGGTGLVSGRCLGSAQGWL